MTGMALIFDMDGVIVDSNPLRRQAWTAYNRRFGIETDETMHQRMYGKRNDEIVRDFFGADLDPEQVAGHGAAKESLYREMMAPVLRESLVPGVTEFLSRHRGLPIGMATNAEPPNVEFLLDNTCLRPFFRAVVNGHQVSRPKPEPEIYLKVAELLGMPPSDCIVFEDSQAGVQAARGAGARVVGILTTHAVLKNVDLSVDDFRSPELETWLQQQIPRG